MRFGTVIFILFPLFSVYHVSTGAATVQTQPTSGPLAAMFQDCLEQTGDGYRQARGQLLDYAQSHKTETMRFLAEQAKSDDYQKRTMARILEAWVSHRKMIEQEVEDIKTYGDRRAEGSVAGDSPSTRERNYALGIGAILDDLDARSSILKDITLEQTLKGAEKGEYSVVYSVMEGIGRYYWGINKARNRQQDIDQALLVLWLTLQDVKAGEVMRVMFYSEAWQRAAHPVVLQHLKQWRSAETTPAGQQFLDRLIPAIEAKLEGRPYVERGTVDQNANIEDFRRNVTWNEKYIADTSIPYIHWEIHAQWINRLHHDIDQSVRLWKEYLEKSTDTQGEYWLKQAIEYADQEIPKIKARHPLPHPEVIK